MFASHFFCHNHPLSVCAFVFLISCNGGGFISPLSHKTRERLQRGRKPLLSRSTVENFGRKQNDECLQPFPWRITHAFQTKHNEHFSPLKTLPIKYSNKRAGVCANRFTVEELDLHFGDSSAAFHACHVFMFAAEILCSVRHTYI